MSEEKSANPILGNAGNESIADESATYDMPFAALRSLAKERGLDSKGTADEIINRLKAFDVAKKSMPNSSEEPAEAIKAEVKDNSSNAPVKDIAKVYNRVALSQKAYFDKQPKVSVIIPFEAGENPAQAVKIAFVVNVNGYQFNIPRGVMVDVPVGVARIVKERLESEGRISREYSNVRIDVDPNKIEALS